MPRALCFGLWPLGLWPIGPLARWPVGRWPLPVTRWPLAVGRWPLAVGPWPLALGPWALGLGLWALGFGLWALGFGLWALDVGPYLTLPSLIVPSLFSFSSHTEKLLPTKYVDHFQVNPGDWWATEGAGCHAKAAMHVGCPCGQSAHVDRSGFFGTWRFEDTTPMSIADVVLVALCVYAGGA